MFELFPNYDEDELLNDDIINEFDYLDEIEEILLILDEDYW